MKDRAKPFSRKHRKYFIPVTGGMILIGVLNVAIGMCSYDKPPDTHQRIELVIPKSDYKPKQVVPVLVRDAGVPDAPAPDAVPSPN